VSGVRGPKSRALAEQAIVIVTVWPSEQHRANGGFALRSASACLAFGDPVEIALPDGSTVVYLNTLPDVDLTDSMTEDQSTLSFSLPWTSDATLPAEFDWRYAVGEAAIIYTIGNGSDVQPWALRSIRVSGAASVAGWGTASEPLSITIGSPSVEDSGDFFPVGAELDSGKFTDIGTESDRGRAHLADGVLPPIIIAPLNSGMLAPLIVVQDETDAVSGTSTPIGYRRWLYCYGKPPSSGSTRQYLLVDDDNTDRFVAGSTSTSYQGILATDTDLEGGVYYYISGNFVETYGNNTVTFTNASADVTATRTNGKIAENDQTRATGGASDEWVVVESRDGSAITLAAAYGGVTSANQEGEVIRLPAEQVYSLWEVSDFGGNLTSPDGSLPLSNAVDVLDWALHLTSITIPVAFGDLAAIRYLVNIDCQTVITERQSPLEWADESLLSWLPIRRYVADGALRFAWVGPRIADVEASIDLSEISDAWRENPVGWGGIDANAAIAVTHQYNYFRERFYSTSNLVGDRDSGLGASEYTSARAQDVWARWQDRNGPACLDRAPVFELESMVIGSARNAIQVADHLLYQTGYDRRSIELELGPAWAWMAPGTIIEIDEPDVISTAKIYRVEVRTHSSSGMIRAVLTEIVD